jgi:hypothetical protein
VKGLLPCAACPRDCATLCENRSGQAKPAVIGGCATNPQISRALAVEGLVTPLGLVATVGFIGLSTFGGYRSFMSHFGMGKDKILGAEIVNAEREIVETNEANIPSMIRRPKAST